MDSRNTIKKAQSVTADNLKAIAHEIDAIQGVIDSAIAYIEAGNALATYNLQSGMAGLTRLQSFSNALSRSVFLAKTGKPLQEGDLKPRSVARKRSSKKKRPGN